jgi:hypothetical protein
MHGGNKDNCCHVETVCVVALQISSLSTAIFFFKKFLDKTGQIFLLGKKIAVSFWQQIVHPGCPDSISNL